MERANTPSVETSLRQLRIVHIAMLFSIVLYGFLSMRAPAHRAPPRVLVYGVGLVSATMVVWIFVIRNKLLTTPGGMSSSDPVTNAVLAPWRTACIVTWAFCEAIALYGLVLRYMGLPMSQAVLFFIAGFGLMLLFAPKRPERRL